MAIYLFIVLMFVCVYACEFCICCAVLRSHLISIVVPFFCHLRYRQVVKYISSNTIVGIVVVRIANAEIVNYSTDIQFAAATHNDITISSIRLFNR